MSSPQKFSDFSLKISAFRLLILIRNGSNNKFQILISKIINHKSNTINRAKKGFVFLEVIIFAALASIAFTALLGLAFNLTAVSYSTKKTAESESLAKEILEAARAFRDGTDWAAGGLGAVSTGAGSPHYFRLDGSVNPPRWTIENGEETMGVFARKVIVDRVSRDPSTGNIEAVYNGSRDDPDTRKVAAVVSWEGKTVQIVSYLTNWQNEEE